MRNRLPATPKRHESGIVNLDTNSGSGTHWVAYKKIGTKSQYYDSFGDLRPPKAIRHYLRNTTLTYNYDTDQKSYEVKCGHYCLRFLARV